MSPAKISDWERLGGEVPAKPKRGRPKGSGKAKAAQGSNQLVVRKRGDFEDGGGPALTEKSKLLAEELTSRREISGPGNTLANAGTGVALLHEKELLERAMDKELAEAGLEDFWIFMTEILYSTPEQRAHYLADFHGRIAYELQVLKVGENFLLVVPREHRKSFLLRAFIAWLITKDLNIRIMIVSVTEDKAKKMAGAVRKMFMRGQPGYEKFHRLYPHVVIDARKELLQAHQFVHPGRTVNYPDPTVYSIYMGGSGTSSRCDVLLIDDGWDNRTLQNPEIGIQVFRKLLELTPLVETSSMRKYGNIIILCTPWKHYDPAAILLGYKVRETAEDIVDATTKLPFKAMIRHAKEDPDRPCEICPAHVVARFPHGHPDWGEKGQPILFPIFTNEVLESKRQIAMMDPAQGEEFFMLQYQCVYETIVGKKFEREWFIQIDKPGWIAPKRKFICIDDASKDFQQPGVGDFSVALFGEFEEDGRLCINYGLRSNMWTRSQFIREIIVYCQARNWYPDAIVKEKVGVDNFLMDISEEFRKIIRPVQAIPIIRVGLGKKLDYIVSSLQGPMERRDVLFGSLFPADLLERVKYEAVNLGKTMHDDVIDCATLFMHPLVRVRGVRKFGGQQGEWVLPSLGLYMGPGQPPPPDTRTEFERAMEESRPRFVRLGLKVQGEQDDTKGGNPRLPIEWLGP